MVAGSSRNYLTSEFLKLCSKGLCVFYNLFLILLKLWFECFSKGNCFSSNKILVWSSLQSWKHHAINRFCVLFFTKYNSSSRSSQSFMSRRSNNITIWDWIFYDSSSNESCNMSNISEKIGSNFVGYLTKSFPVEIT